MLRGRVKEAGFHLVSNQGGKVEYRAVAVLIDPLQKVRSVAVFLIPEAEAKQLKPDENGLYGPASPDMWEFPLKLKGKEFNGPVPLRNPAMTDDVLLQQIRLELADGQFKWTQPARLVVPFSKGAAAPANPTRPNPGQTNPGPQGNPLPAGQAAVGADDWLGGAAVAQPGAGAALGAPVATASNKLLLKEAQTEGDATFRVVDIAGKVTTTMQWSGDGKYLYLLEETGVLHKIGVPEFREEKVLQLGQQTKFMTLTRAGIAIGLPLLQEIWLISPDTLELLKRIPIGGLTGLTGSPVLTNVYAIQGDVLSIVDLEAGQVTAKIKAKEMQRPAAPRGHALGDFRFATVTPNGQYFLCESGGSINRLRINGNELIYEEAGPNIGQNSQRIVVSSDSNYVALPSGGGNSNAAGHPQVGNYATYVYKVTNLQMPVITIASGAYPQTLGFDKAAALLYAQKFDMPLMVFTPGGLNEKNYKLGRTRGGDVHQILPHPSGRKVLIHAGSALIWVELPAPA